jgi:hypothetical protein
VIENAKYHIRSVEDFLEVPEDRIDDCLTEFAAAVRAARHTRNILFLIAEDQGHALPADAVRLPEFIWIDDGERVTRIHSAEAEGGRGE